MSTTTEETETTQAHSSGLGVDLNSLPVHMRAVLEQILNCQKVIHECRNELTYIDLSLSKLGYFRGRVSVYKEGTVEQLVSKRENYKDIFSSTMDFYGGLVDQFAEMRSAELSDGGW